jgi:23S rRNA (adenine2503-C2)-methyltransferase
MTSDTIVLTNLSFSQLKQWVESLGEPRYRARQLRQWIYGSLETEFEDMQNLPLDLREKLQQTARVSGLEPIERQTADNGDTEKVLFRLLDGETVESVLMRYKDRRTVCASTQVGCTVGCPFCTTGSCGFQRDLTSGEIVDQVLFFARELEAEGLDVTNVVLMGMGEPFLNYDASWQAIETLHDPDGFNMGARRFTISTAGVVPGIERLSQQDLQVGLAVSLHAPTDELRDELVPLNRRYPLDVLLPACRRYTDRTGRRVTFEYALINQVNDHVYQAKQLIDRIGDMLCHVNLIPLNPSPDSDYRASPRARVVEFQLTLQRAKISNTLRQRRGVAIQAGCGQLRAQEGVA